MARIGEKIPSFSVTGVKPGFEKHEENGESAFETLTEESFPGKWKVIFFYPKDFTFVCPTEIAEFARLNDEFADRDAVVLGGSTDNEFVKLAWRRNSFTSTVYAPKGSGQLGIAWNDIDAKFRALAPLGGLGGDAISRTLDIIHDFRRAAGVSPLLDLLRPAN